MVTWMTVDHGKVTTAIKGSQRPKSMFLGQYDLFYTCEILYYTRHRHDVHIARECTPLAPRTRLRSDWKASAAASYICDLVSSTSLPSVPQAAVFRLLHSALDHVCDRGALPAFLFWFELKFLHLLGLAPRLRQCLSCGLALTAGARGTRFSYSRGGILCGSCAARQTEAPLSISPAALGTLVGWQRSRTPQVALATRSTEGQLAEIEKLLGLFIGYHLETTRPSRAVSLDTMRRHVA